MASDKNHRPCLPLKPQEKNFEAIIYKLQNERCFWDNGWEVQFPAVL
jgi:hypothetical protein